MRHKESYKEIIVGEYYQGRSIKDIIEKEKIPRSTIYSWLKKYHRHTTKYGTATPKMLQDANKRIKKLEKIIEILQNSETFSNLTTAQKEKEIDLLYKHYDIRTLCAAFLLPPGTYYNHIFRNKGDKSKFAIRRSNLRDRIYKLHQKNPDYGIRRIKASLVNEGEFISSTMVSRLMQELGISGDTSLIKKQNKRLAAYERRLNLLKQDFKAKGPNEVWLGDMTVVAINNVHYYISAYLDLYSRKIVAYRIGRSPSTHLAMETLRMAIKNENPAACLIIHTDNGSAYVSYSMRRLIRHYGFTQSFSRPGKPHDNAPMESFYNTIKREFIYRKEFKSLDSFRIELVKYIDYYNNERIQKSLSNRSPISIHSPLNLVTGKIQQKTEVSSVI